MRLTKDERQQLHWLLPQLEKLMRSARWAKSELSDVTDAGETAVSQLSLRIWKVVGARGHKWQYLPLEESDALRIDQIATSNRVMKLSARQREIPELVIQDLAPNLGLARRSLGLWRRIRGTSAEGEAGSAALWILDRYQSEDLDELSAQIDRLREVAAVKDSAASIEEVLVSQPKIAKKIDTTRPAGVIVRHDLQQLQSAITGFRELEQMEEARRKRVHLAARRLKKKNARLVLTSMSVSRLSDVTRERIPVKALVAGGVETVQDVLDRREKLLELPGVGSTSQRRILGAANTLEQISTDEATATIDVDNPLPETKSIVARLWEWDETRTALDSAGIHEKVSNLSGLVGVGDQLPEQVMLFGEHEHVRPGIAELIRQVSNGRRSVHPDRAWEDFLERPAHYYALMDELGIIQEDADTIEGGLPAEIVEAVRNFSLDTSLLNVSLRGYQHFAARFGLVQRKVIIGDEMGLGKTIEALAVFAHLSSQGEKHFLVVCPAAVLSNWVREVQSKSRLRAYMIHGSDRYTELHRWLTEGGVAVTTFGTLPSIQAKLDAAEKIAALVVDEAHYIKNPKTQRSRNSAKLVSSVDYAVFLTGTPLENKVIEFSNLVRYLNPELEIDMNDFRPGAFRLQVAPAYLRRNQEDVLSELPDLIQVEEWIPLEGHERAAYRKQVEKGTFHAMRQSAMLSGARTAKMQRLLEIAEEANENERKVIIYSNYRAVIEKIAAAIPERSFGPITGSVSPGKRQKMIDDFQAAENGAVLISQIQAGGVGLNIQAASVVIIVEPQLKPTTEWQAIARAHRMGQLRTVQVHRLLSEKSVDASLTELLAKKGQIFQDFAAVSEIAQAAPEAFDISDAALVKEVVAAEQRRLKGEDFEEKPEEQLDEHVAELLEN